MADKYEEDTRYNIEAGYIKSATQLHLWTLFYISGLIDTELTRDNVRAIMSSMQAIHGEYAREWT